MIRVFEFSDGTDYDYEYHCSKIVFVDINKEIEELEKNGWEIISVSKSIIKNYSEKYRHWYKSCYMVVAKFKTKRGKKK